MRSIIIALAICLTLFLVGCLGNAARVAEYNARAAEARAKERRAVADIVIGTAILSVVVVGGYLYQESVGGRDDIGSYLAKLGSIALVEVFIPLVFLAIVFAGWFVAFNDPCLESIACADTAQLAFVIGWLISALVVMAHRSNLLEPPNQAPDKFWVAISIPGGVAVGFIVYLFLFKSNLDDDTFYGILSLLLTSSGLTILYFYWLLGKSRPTMALGTISFAISVLSLQAFLQ